MSEHKKILHEQKAEDVSSSSVCADEEHRKTDLLLMLKSQNTHTGFKEGCEEDKQRASADFNFTLILQNQTHNAPVQRGERSQSPLDPPGS